MNEKADSLGQLMRQGGADKETPEMRRASLEASVRAEETPEMPVVLIAEDEEPIAAVLAMIVEDAGYQPLTAMHGREALALALKEHPALILTDLMMPYLDGADFIAELHKAMDDEGQKAPPVVLMTAAGMRQARAAGADALLRKPFNVDEVEAILRHYLGEAMRQGRDRRAW